MDSSLFFGGSVVAAMVAGSVSLFAPCCISVMMPAYLSSAFQNRRILVAMTFLFAAGIATVILPIALGAVALQRLLVSEHTLLYVLAGTAMLALAAFVFLGGKLRLPAPGRRAGGATGPLGVYSLGIFSGFASSCCAPVLAGVLALSGVASSFGLALGLGSAFVFGMVAPLFVLALVWERLGERAKRGIFRPRSFSWRIGPLHRTLSGAALASAALLALMGGATLWIGLTTDVMPSAQGWQADVSATLQHWGSVLTDALSGVPGWLATGVLAITVLLLLRLALRQLSRDPEPRSDGGAEAELQIDGARDDHRGPKPEYG